MVWEPATSEYFVYDQSPKTKEQRERREKSAKALSNFREVELTKKFLHNPVWAKNMDSAEVGEINDRFRRWVDQGILPGTPAPAPNAGEDVQMG